MTTVDVLTGWCKGCTVSRKLRHVNLREMLVREAQRLGYIHVMHVPGKLNIADILTKEMKDDSHYRDMVDVITSPRLLNVDPWANGGG